MSPTHDPLDDHVIDDDQAQLWLRQRRLRTARKPELAGDPACNCQVDGNSPLSPNGTIDSSQILRGRREVGIVHAGETYRLLVTRNNKLILQK